MSGSHSKAPLRRQFFRTAGMLIHVFQTWVISQKGARKPPDCTPLICTDRKPCSLGTYVLHCPETRQYVIIRKRKATESFPNIPERQRKARKEKAIKPWKSFLAACKTVEKSCRRCCDKRQCSLERSEAFKACVHILRKGMRSSVLSSCHRCSKPRRLKGGRL